METPRLRELVQLQPSGRAFKKENQSLSLNALLGEFANAHCVETVPITKCVSKIVLQYIAILPDFNVGNLNKIHYKQFLLF